MSELITNKPKDYKPTEYKYTLIDRYEDFINDCKDVFYYNPRQWIRNIKRLIYWVPVIWNDRDWDGTYLYKIVDHKLQSIERDTFNWNRIDAEQQRETIRRTREAIKLAIADEQDLVDNEYKAHTEKYGKIVTWTTPVQGSDSLRELHIAHEKCDTQELVDQESEDSDKIWKLARERHSMYRNRVWKMINKHIDRWWD